jgi:hypothetical protein
LRSRWSVSSALYSSFAGLGMVTYMGARPLVPGDRLYDVIHNLWITFDALCIASLAVEGKPIPDNESDQLTFVCNQANAQLQFTVGKAFKPALEGRMADLIRVVFRPKMFPQPKFIDIRMPSLDTVTINLASSAVVSFWERHTDWIYKTLGRGDENEKWPEIFRMTWAIRNAAAHHGGCLRFTAKAMQPIVWHGLKYELSDNGKQVFGTDLHFADFVMLLFEVSDELDARNCPIP